MNKTIEEILNSYPFTHKFYVKYACLCARHSFNRSLKSIDMRSLKIVELAERFSNGEQIHKKDLQDAAYAAADATDAAYAYAIDVSYPAANVAAYVAMTAVNAITYPVTYTAACCAAAATAAGAAVYTEELKQILLDLINREYSNLELTLMGFKNDD